jgi:hypothetical protein
MAAAAARIMALKAERDGTIARLEGIQSTQEPMSAWVSYAGRALALGM